MAEREERPDNADEPLDEQVAEALAEADRIAENAFWQQQIEDGDNIRPGDPGE